MNHYYLIKGKLSAPIKALDERDAKEQFKKKYGLTDSENIIVRKENHDWNENINYQETTSQSN